jgi:cytosine/adenosine deaminase-related metal-dependent hydrolase
MPLVHRAAWVLPIDAPPIRDGWVEVDDGRIVAVGAQRTENHEREPRTENREPERGTSNPDPSTPLRVGLSPSKAEPRTAILPALVNAHTHLELSWMRGRVPPGEAMPAWAARLMGERQMAASDPSGTGHRRAAVVAAIAEARASGTGLVGDVANTFDAYGPLAESGLSAAVFFELLGFRTADPNTDPGALVAGARQLLAALPRHDRLRTTIVPHAPYSVSPDLFHAIAAVAGGRPLSVHLGESAEEVRFLRDGTGPWRDLLEQIGAWAPEWVPPACGPVDYMERLGLLNDRLIAVHGVQFEDDELRRLAACGATVVACPRSNRWTGAGTPPISRFYAADVRVALGTDSLASVEDFNLFSEIAEVRRLAPDIPARQILRSATLDGATALGFGSELGSIAPGKRAELIAVRIPPGVADVEEYLVGGIQACDIQWLVNV